ncbi:histidinol-phosphate aminotransferase family protein [Pendulispora brunnea]|uniref:Histidinol-phosphate aminotransferase family protein n=1 Tax=Pendulispora brunnea TaxID=2905690 RepID=A0ABZ2JWU1_9BACT
MSRPYSEVVRPGIAAMKLYSSNREPCAIDLSDNTNQRGAPPSARTLVPEANIELFARYPNHYAADLKRAISAHLGVGTDEIVTGCGSDDVLDSAIRAFAQPGGAIAYPDPTFVMIPYCGQVNDLALRPVPLLGPERGWDVDADALLAQRACITYVCSPNNPTGTRASAEAIERIVAEAEGVVLLDEAYIEYCGGSFVRRAKDAGRLLVIRTFSKAFGLAGARVGYAIGAPELVAAVEVSRGPYKVTQLAERVTVSALENDAAWVEGGIREVLDARARFMPFLERLGLKPIPSDANFVLVPVKDAAAQTKALRERGVAVRPFPKLPGFGDAVRISVGPWEIMERALPSFEEVLSCV